MAKVSKAHVDLLLYFCRSVKNSTIFHIESQVGQPAPPIHPYSTTLKIRVTSSVWSVWMVSRASPALPTVFT